MPFAFANFEKGFNIVMVQTGSISHMRRFDLERTRRGLRLKMQQCQPKQIIQGVPERISARSAFAFDALYNILVQRYCCSDAHDAFSIAPMASSSGTYR